MHVNAKKKHLYRSWCWCKIQLKTSFCMFIFRKAANTLHPNMVNDLASFYFLHIQTQQHRLITVIQSETYQNTALELFDYLVCYIHQFSFSYSTWWCWWCFYYNYKIFLSDKFLLISIFHTKTINKFTKVYACYYFFFSFLPFDYKIIYTRITLFSHRHTRKKNLQLLPAHASSSISCAVGVR